MQVSVLCLVDHSHAAAAQLLDDPVMKDNLGYHALHRIGSYSRLLQERRLCFFGASLVGLSPNSNGAVRNVCSYDCYLEPRISPSMRRFSYTSGGVRARASPQGDNLTLCTAAYLGPHTWRLPTCGLPASDTAQDSRALRSPRFNENPLPT
jgi:hypothetical protein